MEKRSRSRSRSRSASPKPKDTSEIDLNAELNDPSEPVENESEEYYNYDDYAYYILIVYDKHGDNEDNVDVFYAPKGKLNSEEVLKLHDWSRSSNYFEDYLSAGSRMLPPRKKDHLEGQPTTPSEVREHRMLQERFANTLVSHCNRCDCIKNRLELIDFDPDMWFSETASAFIKLRANKRPDKFH